MQELASWTIRAVKLFVVSLALLCLVIARLISTLLQFVCTMSKWAGVWEFADAIKLPKLADFCLEFHLEALLTCTSNYILTIGLLRLSIFLLECLVALSIWGSCSGLFLSLTSHILNKLRGSEGFKMIAKAVIFPGLGLSLTLEVLHLNVFWLSGSLFLTVFSTRITDGHCCTSLCWWSVCIDLILRVQSLGRCLLLLAIIGICELVLLWAGRDELGRVNVSLEISSERMRPRLEILSARILNNLVGWLLHILSSVGLNWLLLMVCELNQLVMGHTGECLLWVTFLRLRKAESWHCALWVVLVLGWLSMIVWCSCSIWYALVQGLGVNWSTNYLLHWVHQLGECIQVCVLLLSLVVGVWGRARHSGALRLGGHHPILLRRCAALLTMSLLLRHHGFCGRSD